MKDSDTQKEKEAIGHVPVDPDSYIIPLIHTLPKLESVDAHMVLADVYETNFGIYNHLDVGSKRPMSSVALHGAEDNYKTSRLYETIENFVTKDIYKSTGLSLTEFLNLPTEACLMILEAVEKKSVKETVGLNQLQNEISNLGKK